ncbi:o-methyltransferase, putative [Ricinus communis]|uniref:O-methyltransferase, putative n=1 Tax=Ricinus communis TaxID=3988 RepID=B9RGD7_RICCO|nr:o-methyltransferase, putative [Ricinus communis]|eukprot:XP_002513089.1 caffeic acid 3-O-methyltransferase [Ricinus communis]
MDTVKNLQASNVPSSLSQEDEEVFTSGLHVCSSEVFSHALSNCIQLGLFDIIAEAGPSAYLTATEITAQLPTKNPDAVSMIDRMLRLFSCHSLLNSSLKTVADDVVETRYGLSPIGHLFVRKKDGVTMAACFTDYKAWTEAWLHLKDAILEGGNPYEKAHGVPIYEHISSDTESVKGFSQAMDSISSFIMKKVLENYSGFKGLGSLVDVGGGSGFALNMITSEYPSISCINFDLPHVVQEAPYHPGVKHVGGDMFLDIPSADAIMIKEVLHNWGNEDCVKVLKNCYEALPKGGKVIVVSHVMPEVVGSSNAAAKYVCQLDVMMLLFGGGKERTEKEFKALGKAAGFSGFQLICFAAYNAVAVMEFYK